VKAAHQQQTALEAALQQFLATVQPFLRKQALQDASLHLIHPGMVLAAPQLTAAHPLRREALAVADAFEAVTNGMQTRDVMTALEALEEDSIFQPWRHLILGIHFFYEQLDEAASAHFLAVPLHSPLSALSRTLLSFLDLPGGVPVATSAARSLFEKIHRTDPELSALVQRLTDGLESGDEVDFWNTLADFLETCRDGELGARCVLWVWGQLEWLDFDEQQLLDLTIALWAKPEAYRLAALGSAPWDPEASALFWMKFLIHALRDEVLSDSQLVEAHALVEEFYQAAVSTEPGPPSDWLATWNTLAVSWTSECRLRRLSFPVPLNPQHRVPVVAESGVRGQLDLFAL